MKVLQIINSQRKPLLEITWQEPDVVDIFILRENERIKIKEDLAPELFLLFNKFKNEGVPLHTTQKITPSDGSVKFVEDIYLIKVDDERFLEALSDYINFFPLSMDQERLFALIK